MISQILVTLTLVISTVFAYRVLRLIYDPDHRPKSSLQHRPLQTRLMIVLGSGGHTAEMLALLRDLDTQKYTHRSYVVTSGDEFSARKAEQFERELSTKKGTIYANRKQKLQGQVDDAGSFDIAIVPRARRIYQSMWTTPFSSLLCFWACMKILRTPKTRPPRVIQSNSGIVTRPEIGSPDLIITNGPATGVIVVFASLFVRLLRLRGCEGKMRTIYVESWARVRRLSLSGRMLLRVVDRFVVQWEALVAITQGRAEYIGVLV